MDVCFDQGEGPALLEANVRFQEAGQIAHRLGTRLALDEGGVALHGRRSG
ncbi:MAG TPA: hypothetical protein VFG93_02110 [Gaiellaceae bacterium]|nr:hypothetical protein [Gaiellaceae bacterium]